MLDLRPTKPQRGAEMQGVINGILYMVRGGCSWRMLPKEYGPWQTVYGYFRTFRRTGVWKQINDALREKVRRKAGKKPTPSTAILDSESVKTTEKGDFAATDGVRLGIELDRIGIGFCG